jgi:hypothetical protein
LKASQKNNAFWFLVIGLIYFAVFVFPNLQGARNAAMLAAFEIDEYAQYPHLIGMLTPGDSLYQSLRNFLIYEHYFYGYPFYFLSALAVFPQRLIEGSAWPQSTPVIVATLRQAISVLPMILSVFLLVKMQTRLRPVWKAVGLFIFLLLVPAVVRNNLWWHPDSLAMLACVMVVFFLDRDDLRFGSNFFFAAAACGIAAGLKLSGFFFGLAIPIYLAWGFLERKIPFRRVLILAAAFLLVLAAALTASNPLLLLPQERQEIFKTMLLQFEQTSSGVFFYQKGSSHFLNSIDDNFKTNFGSLVFLLCVLIAFVLQFLLPESRNNSRRQRLLAVILAWILPLMITIDLAAYRRTNYFLPVMIPFLSILGGLPFEDLKMYLKGSASQRLAAAGLILMAGLVIFQTVQFARVDFTYIQDAARKEQKSPALAFHQTLDHEYLPLLGAEKLVIFRDWRMYFPSSPTREIEMSWDMASYDFINPINPDLILLERANLELFAQYESVEKAVDKEKSRSIYEFYRDALENRIEGYTIMYADNFGLAFVKSEIWNR